MSNIRGCNLPDDLFYLVEKHVWAKPIGNGVIRVGMTSVAGKLSGGKLAAVTVKTKNLGTEVKQGKSLATIESSKFVGPVPTPVSGVLLRANEKLADNPNIVIADPYGEGWIAEIQPTDWEGEKSTLATGQAGLAAYQVKMEADGVSCN
ncbi:MAG: glycine cleavage system protein H [Chloroflexi bacterium]|nr:glycine cleavage system protein H [Chloroflexota bacterium]